MRQITQEHPVRVRELPMPTPCDPAAWLAGQAKELGLQWLLAYALDGVIWGRFDGGALLTSTGAATTCPPLRPETLLQARLFGPGAEVLLWADASLAWQARLLQDTAPGGPCTWQESFDEGYLLWGSHGEVLPEGFTLLREGAQGMVHAVPLRLPLAADGQLLRRPRLWVRHYLADDDAARVAASRLLNVEEGA